MHFLPKANPLYEQIDARKVAVPDVLEKLGKGGFTGYLSHTVAGFECYCIFARGKLICALSTEHDKDKTGFEALNMMFDKILGTGGEINVYRMTADLAMCAHALVLGTKLFNGDEVRQVDIKAVLARLKNQELNGVVRFYTDQRYALLFYKLGQPIGFYHDSAKNIEVSPEESRKIATLPGARLEVSATKPLDELMLYDLLQMVNVAKLWEAAGARQASSRGKADQKQEKPAIPPQATEKLPELVADLKEVAMAYLSKEGGMAVEKLLQECGGIEILCDGDKTAVFLAKMEKEAARIDSSARIDEMIDLMKSEVAGRLAV